LTKDQIVGVIILVAGIVGILAYGWVIYAYPIVVLQITAFLAVAGVLGIAAWIGWTMATTPSPKPIETEVGRQGESAESQGTASTKDI
jgi:hypothetical protein